MPQKILIFECQNFDHSLSITPLFIQPQKFKIIGIKVSFSC
jgi:hypothetical protein